MELGSTELKSKVEKIKEVEDEYNEGRAKAKIKERKLKQAKLFKF